MPFLLKRPRLTVRVMMLMVLVLAVWLGWHVHLARKQREAVAAIEAYGGNVGYDWEFVGLARKRGGSPWAPRWLLEAIGSEFFQDVVLVDLLPGGPPDGEWRADTSVPEVVMDGLAGFTKLNSIYIKRTQATDRSMEVIGRLADLQNLVMADPAISDSGLARLNSLGQLKSLHISGSHISDDGLACLADLHRLEILSFESDRFTDRGVTHLKGLTRLRKLDLGFRTGITDAGIAQIAGLHRLERLTIEGSRVTDAGIRKLDGLTRLKDLGVGGSLVTKEGLSWLRGKLPNLKIIH